MLIFRPILGALPSYSAGAMNRVIKILLSILLFAWVTSILSAQTIRGTVHNENTGKPSLGDEVVLIRPVEGMVEEARTKTGSEGEFTLNLIAPLAPHVVRVIHQNVNYDQTVTGTGPMQIIVYNSAAKVPGLNGNIGIAQMESDGKILQVTEMYAITNNSNPPLTQSRPDNYDITLPPEAVFDSVEARRGKGIWVKVTPDPIKTRARTYAINFPIRPGETLFKFVYHLPYRGRATLHLRLPYPIKNFGVMHPPSMAFKALHAHTFKSPGLAEGLQLEQAVATPLQGDVPAFEISGIGKAAEPVTGTKGVTPAAPLASATDANHPSASHAANPAATGASGRDQSRRELWLVVDGILLILAIFGFALWRIRKAAKPVARKSADGQSTLLESLKEELFQLESGRLHGSISAEEYAATKDALSQSIQRALARVKR